jgi:hypothetical protein
MISARPGICSGNRRLKWRPVAIAFLAAAATLTAAAAAPEKIADGIIVPVGDQLLKVEVCADDIIRVATGRDRAFFARRSLAMEAKRRSRVKWRLETTDNQAKLTTAKLAVLVDLKTGAVAFRDAAGMLTIGRRRGSFRGMLKDRTFHVVLVSKDRPAGFSSAPRPDGVARYVGLAVDVRPK